MNCESKKISELPGVTKVYPNDLIPIVQDGTNKYITAKDLLGCHDHSGDDCCCSQALSKAITALDFSRTAMDLANKAYDKACLIGTKLAALEEKVAEHDTLICNIRSLITLIFNKFEELEGNLKVTIQLSIDDQNKKYKVLQGTREVETILVPRPTTDFENGDGRPADAAEVLRRLRNLKGEVSKNLNFVAGKFTLNGESYNGTTEKTLNIPTRTSHLINDGDPDGNPFLTGVKGYDGRTAPVTDGIADLSRIPIKLDDLNDVDAANPQAGDILYYDGTKWVNTPLQDLVESIIDCDYIQNCVSNFKVTPKTHNKTATETTAEYTVEATGAWTVAKESGDFITNFTPSGNGNGTITVTFGNNATLNTRTAKFIVTETATGRTARITINQSGVTPTVDRTITYNISGGLTNSIKVNNEAVSNGGQKTAPDGSNYTVSIVSNDPGYRIANVTPSAGTYNNGTLTINPITADATVQVVLELIPAGLVTITYTGDIDKVDSGLPSGNVETVASGSHYTNTITPINGYQFDSITVSPSGTSDPTTGDIEISSVTDTTTINIVASEVLSDPNIFNGINEFDNTRFNSFGVVEERFLTDPAPVTPEVSDPYSAASYTNGARMYYQLDLGTWDYLDNNISLPSTLDISSNYLSEKVGELYTTASAMLPEERIPWITATAQILERLSHIKNHTNLVYYPDATGDPTSLYKVEIPAEYGLKSGASNSYPFYIVIVEEDCSQISSIGDIWDLHVYAQLWCMPTDFPLSPSSNVVSEAEFKWKNDRYPYENKAIGVCWKYVSQSDPNINFLMLGLAYGIEREVYKLELKSFFSNSIQDSECNAWYPSESTATFTTGGVQEYRTTGPNNYQNTPVAAFVGATVSGVKVPGYTVEVRDSNDLIVSGILYGINNVNNSYDLEISNFPALNEFYKVTITAVSTDPSRYPSLSETLNVRPTDDGQMTCSVLGAVPTLTVNNDDGGYGGSDHQTDNPPGVHSRSCLGGTPSRAGWGLGYVIPDSFINDNISVTWDCGGNVQFNIPVYTATNRTLTPASEQLALSLYFNDMNNFVATDSCMKTGIAVRTTDYDWSEGLIYQNTPVIEIFIPYVAKNNTITVSISL